jgi:hypothetical protein
MPAAAFGLLSAALMLSMCVPAMKSKAAERRLQWLRWPSLAAVALGALALVTGTPVLAGWLTSGGLAALVLLAGLLSEREPPKREPLRAGQEPPDDPDTPRSGVQVDWERFEADLAAWAATAGAPATDPPIPVGRDSQPLR